MKWYNCGVLGHPTYRCFDKPSSSNLGKRITYAQEENYTKDSKVDHIESKKEEKLMFRRVTIEQPALDEPKHRRALFRIRCKILGKVCKVVVDFGSTDNIISYEVVNKLKLTKIPRVSPYKVTWINKGQSTLVNE